MSGQEEISSWRIGQEEYLYILDGKYSTIRRNANVNNAKMILFKENLK